MGLGESGAAGAEQCCQPGPALEAAAPLRPPCAPAVRLAAKAGSRVLQTRCLKTASAVPSAWCSNSCFPAHQLPRLQMEKKKSSLFLP